jgi:hypothetical protein
MYLSMVNARRGDSLQHWRGKEDSKMAVIYFHPAVGGPVSPAAGSYLIAWVKGDFPIGAGPTAVTTTNVTGFNWTGTPGDPWVLGACHLRHFWVSTQSGGTITHGAMVAVGSLGPNVPDDADHTFQITARVRVNNKDRFKFLKFYLTDGVSNSYVSGDLLSQLDNDTWGEVRYPTPNPDSNLRNWPSIRFSLTACGTDDYTKVGETDFCVEWFKLEID